MSSPGVWRAWTLLMLAFWSAGSLMVSRWLSSGRGVTAWMARIPAMALGLNLDLDLLSGEWDEDSLLLWGECDLLDILEWDVDPWDLEYELLLDHWWCLCLSSLLGDLDQLCRSFLCFGVWDQDWDFECLPLKWGGDRDLCFFLEGDGGSSFIFSFERTFSSSEDSLPLLELLDDDKSSDSGFIACYADCFDLEEGSGEPSPAEPQVIWELFCDWNLWDHFFDFAPSDFFGVSVGVMSAVPWLFWSQLELKYSSRLSSGGLIFFNDESLSFLLELQVAHLGIGLAHLLSPLSTSPSLSLSALAASAAAASYISDLGCPFLWNMFEDLASICSIFIIWWVQPYRQGVHSLCLCSSTMVLKWWVRFSPMWFAWFDNSVNHTRSRYSTFLDMSFSNPPLIRPTAATYQTHQDHPVMESNVHEWIPAVVRLIAVQA